MCCVHIAMVNSLLCISACVFSECSINLTVVAIVASYCSYITS